MRSDMRNYWRDVDYWRWWWEARVSGGAKAAIAVMVAAACGIAGYVGAHRLAADEEATTFTRERVVTVVRKTAANAPPRVVTRSETVTRSGEPEVVTVRRDGSTVVVREPGETVTVRAPVDERVVTNARIATVTTTETANRRTTVTEPAATVTTPPITQTVTREVTQPLRTVTETTRVTTTDEVTVTDEITVTDETTVTQTVTTTVTVRR